MGFLTAGAVKSDWYKKELRQPFFQPPPYVFGPVWTGLYIMMGYASVRIYEQLDGDFKTKLLAKPLFLYLTQLVFNFAWTPIFFRMRKLLLASIDISILWGLIIVTIVEFHKIDPIASYLLLPYLAWVSFASILCISITKLNWKQKPE